MRRAAMATAGLAALGVILVLATAAAPPEGSETRHLNLPGGSNGLPYSHVVEAGDTVYLSGGIGFDPETGEVPDDVNREIAIMLDGMKAKLELAGLTMDDLVSVQVFCSDLSLYGKFNDAYRGYFKEKFPARAFIGTGPLLRGGHFEIQGVARRR